MPTFSFDKVNRIIEVAAPDTEVTIQQLINAIRDWEDEPHNMEVAQVARASGKESLGGGVAVGITLELLNNWQLKFEDRPGPNYIKCTVKDGNLVGGLNGDPIKESTYTQIRLIFSAAGTVTGLPEVAQESSVQQLIDSIGIPTSSIADDIDAVGQKTANLPSDPAAQSLVEYHVSTEVDDLITRVKGLEAIYDAVDLRALEDTLQAVKGLVKEKASFKI